MQEKIDGSKGPTADSDAVAAILSKILAPNTDDGIGTDNMTCILINLNNDKLWVNWSQHKNQSLDWLFG
jgi:serine/threonine protein phosphatase PrpC